MAPRRPTFFSHHGFQHVYTETRGILALSTVDWSHVEEMAAGLVHGYVVQVHDVDLPDALLTAYAEAKQVRRADPTGDMELRPSSYDTDRLPREPAVPERPGSATVHRGCHP